jgi:hypothetical protein
MSVVALSHGYPPLWNMGGEVALHRAMLAIRGDRHVLTSTPEPYIFEGVNVRQINTDDVLNTLADPKPIAEQLKDINARVVIGQNELSLPAVKAAKLSGAISVVNVHTPPRFGGTIRAAMPVADYAVYNTQTAAIQWGEPDAFVLHPPISPLPNELYKGGDAYTLLSSLTNKGVEVVLNLAKVFPTQRFIIVRSPAEPTHGLADIEQRVADLPNVELHPRVPPEEVWKYLQQTRILLVPSRYETYGMSAIEAAGYGIPSIHVDTPHVREGIGDAAVLIPPLDLQAAANAINHIESNYETFSVGARQRAEWLHQRQNSEIAAFADFIDNLKKPIDNRARHRAVTSGYHRYKRSF